MSTPTIRTTEQLVAEQDARDQAAAAAAAKATERAAKMAGVEFEGVMCSAHKEDQWGLPAVLAHVRDTNTPVDFEFKNGSTLTLTPENVDVFESTWSAFRMSFF